MSSAVDLGVTGMLCQICEKQAATVHTIDIVNNQKTERHICETCYKEQGLADPFSQPEVKSLLKLKPPTAYDLESLANIVENLGTEVGKASKSCPNCGLTITDFKKKGTVGCETCFDVYAKELESLILKLHGARSHCGKVPRSVETERARRHQAALLQTELDRAINEERFEEAASLRDRIRALETASSDASALHKSESDRHD